MPWPPTPADQQTALQLAHLCRQSGDNDRAEEVVSAALSASPEDLRLLMALGTVRLYKEDFAGAEEVLRKAVDAPRFSPGPRARARMESLSEQAQERRQAMQDRRAAAQRRRPNVPAQIALVRALIPQKKLSEAREILSGLPRSGLRGMMVQRLYGDAFVEEGKIDAAVQSYRAGILTVEGGDQVLAKIDAAAGDKPATGKAALKPYLDEFERRASGEEFDSDAAAAQMRERAQRRREAAEQRREQRQGRLQQFRQNGGWQGVAQRAAQQQVEGGDAAAGQQQPARPFWRAMMARRQQQTNN